MYVAVYVLVFLLGLSIGSFLNVLIDRLSEGRTLMGRSMCDFCRKTLGPLELIPVLSFLVQKGYSRCCAKPMSWQYPVVELLTSVTFIVTWSVGITKGFGMPALVALLTIASALIVITIADLKYRIIPDAMHIVLIVATSVFLWPQLTDTTLLLDRILAAALLFGGMGLLFMATKGRGLGFGDVKFAGVIGYMLGLSMGFLSLYVAFVTGGIFAIILLLTTKRGFKSEVAFGPFMVWGMVVAYLYGREIMQLAGQFFF